MPEKQKEYEELKTLMEETAKKLRENYGLPEGYPWSPVVHDCEQNLVEIGRYYMWTSTDTDVEPGPPPGTPITVVRTCRICGGVFVREEPVPDSQDQESRNKGEEP